MGYYTFYRLEVFQIEKLFDTDDENSLKYLPNETDEHATQISKIVLNDCEDLFEGNIKWYDHQQDMMSYSISYPDLVFCLTGEGEDREDNWKEWYKNGKMYICEGRIEYDEFDIKSIL